MITIKGNLILDKDTTYEEDLKVEGSIIGKDGRRYNLTVKGDINCGDIDCGDIDCGDINCGDIDCRDINCGNINCGNINCRNINCRDINCGNINCGNIDYYAVCFAYNNIKCKSIKGRRENSKHFVLDGKIEIIEEKKVCKECGRELE